ncbi:2'-5' RNA ligase family protein [Methanoregula sp.]|uniref:2'-5' RNA ligase family protein n=1 Tax=Methanoregula sp. TaxID=2052170 RepID=UPI0035618652
MEDTYLVEIRLAATKWRIRETIFAIAGKFHLEAFMERHPHITLFGPLVLGPGTTPADLLETIGTAACRYGPVPFMINGWQMRQGMHGSVIAFSVTPSGSLAELARSLAASLLPVTTSLNAWDSKPEAKWFHITVANRLSTEQASACFSRINRADPGTVHCETAKPGFISRIVHLLRKIVPLDLADHFPPLLLDGTGLRITVMQNEEILAEYDLLEKHWVYSDHGHDSRIWQDTLRNFRRFAGFELETPREADPEDIFVIADMHLGHANIIRYCSRPFLFTDCAEMDTVLIRNWNLTTGDNAPIYHLGDLRYGQGAPPVSGYVNRLGGRATFIKGNHDDEMPGWVKSAEIVYNGIRFFLVHDPADAPHDFDGWVIHGHHHNNELRDFPFMNFTNRRINVSAEVVGYVPVSLEELSRLIRKNPGRKMCPPLILRYPYVLPEGTVRNLRKNALSGS